MNRKYLSPEQLRGYSYFSSLPDQTLERLSGRLRIIGFSEGTNILKQGQPADALYLLAHGEAQVLRSTQWGQQAKIATLRQGAVFGEMGLWTCAPRCCTIISKTDTILYRLHKKDFEEIVWADNAFSRIAEQRFSEYIHYNTIKTLQPFALLEPEQMNPLVDASEERHFSPGDNIILDGEEGYEYYVIKSGSVAVFKRLLKQDSEFMAILSEGEGFGEEALINRTRRSATVQAITPTALYVVPQVVFDRTVKSSYLKEISPDSISLEKKNDYNLLDVRMDIEYEEEHLQGAQHIPLDELRVRYPELSPERAFYTYCLTGARSATAAFLLNSYGVNAKNIRGGLSTWDNPSLVQSHSEPVSLEPT